MQKSIAVLATVLFSTLTIGAQAADSLESPQFMAPEEASFAGAPDYFTGAYVGGSAGVVTSDNFDEDSTRATFGAQIGYLQQFGTFVIGAEAEALYLNDLQYQLAATGGLTQNWSLAVKARAGVAVDRALLYGAAGFGITDFGTYGDATTPDEVRGGVMLGAGVEYAFTDTISARVEYLQTRYYDVSSTAGGVARTDDLVNHAVKVGLNYRF